MSLDINSRFVNDLASAAVVESLPKENPIQYHVVNVIRAYGTKDGIGMPAIVDVLRSYDVPCTRSQVEYALKELTTAGILEPANLINGRYFLSEIFITLMKEKLEAKKPPLFEVSMKIKGVETDFACIKAFCQHARYVLDMWETEGMSEDSALSFFPGVKLSYQEAVSLLRMFEAKQLHN